MSLEPFTNHCTNHCSSNEYSNASFADIAGPSHHRCAVRRLSWPPEDQDKRRTDQAAPDSTKQHHPKRIAGSSTGSIRCFNCIINLWRGCSHRRAHLPLAPVLTTQRETCGRWGTTCCSGRAPLRLSKDLKSRAVSTNAGTTSCLAVSATASFPIWARIATVQGLTSPRPIRTTLT